MKVDVTHPDRLVFPEVGITKGDVIDYYRHVARWMLPLIKERPLTVQRFPRGIGTSAAHGGGKGFVQQDISRSGAPGWLRRIEVPRLSGGSVEHAVADRPEALAWLANQGAIAVHMWTARCTDLTHPDLVVFDLDPAQDDFGVVRDTALAARDLLSIIGLRPYVQVTGSRGVHVVAPIKTGPAFDEVRDFARGIGERLAHDDATHRTVAVRKADRRGRLYIDVMRNGYAQTTVAPYSVRARPNASVAAPITWEELGDDRMRPDGFTLLTILGRLADRGDPWSGMRRHAASFGAASRRLAGL